MAKKVNPEICVGCGACIAECPVAAIVLNDTATIDPDACIGCGACESACPTGAIE